jgi:hypothetical protein
VHRKRQLLVLLTVFTHTSAEDCSNCLIILLKHMSTGTPEKHQDRPTLSSLVKNCWSAEALSARGWRGSLQSTWRIIVTTFHGVKENRLPQQSAALTYYTLMSIGPLVALALTISGYILSNPAHREDNIAKKAVVSAIEWVAPQMNSGAQSANALRASTADSEPHTLGEISANLDKMVDQLLENAANGCLLYTSPSPRD